MKNGTQLGFGLWYLKKKVKIMDYIKGIDISVLQAGIDFIATAATGVQFCVCRCGVGNSSIDPNYTKNITAGKAAGMKMMAYHFIYPLPPSNGQPLRDPIKQANYHWTAAKGEIACIDCEWPAPQDFSKWGCSPAQINAWMMAYFQEYTRLDGGRKPLLYTYPYWAEAIKFDQSFTQYPLWIASYAATPSIPAPFTDWALWQNTGGTEKLPNGIPVDTDFAKDLSLWDAQTVAQVPDQTPVSDPGPINEVPQASVEIPVDSTTSDSNVQATPTPVIPVQPNIMSTISGFFNSLFKK